MAKKGIMGLANAIANKFSAGKKPKKRRDTTDEDLRKAKKKAAKAKSEFGKKVSDAFKKR